MLSTFSSRAAFSGSSMQVSLVLFGLCLGLGYSEGAILGEVCLENVECSEAVANSECGIRRTCDCARGFVRIVGDNERCYQEITDFETQCEVSAQCRRMSNAKCGGEEGTYKCTCDEGYVKNAALDNCVKVAEFIEDKCEVQLQCINFISAECNLQVGECRCFSNFVPNPGLTMCLARKPNLGDDCDISSQCSVSGAYCDPERKCRCNSEHITHDRRCLPYINNIQAGICEITQQCPENSHCGSNGEGVQNCFCNAGFIKDKKWSKCLPLRDQIGGTCEEKDQCLVEDAVCASEGGVSYCDCKEGFVAKEDRLFCLPVVDSLNLPCEEGRQCVVPNSRCDAGFCACRPNFLPFGNKECLRKLNIESGTCNLNAQCPENAQCNGMCECSDGFVSSADKTTCLPARNTIGGVCIESGQCLVNGAICADNESGPKICSCPDDHVTNSAFNVCAPRATVVEAECSIQEQCDGLNGWCAGAFGRMRCICKPGSSPNNDNSYCLPTSLGGPCLESVDCSAWPDSSCRGSPKVCRCNSNFVENAAKDACVPIADLEGVCTESEQCSAVENADCLGEEGDKKCRCVEGYVPVLSSNTCVKKAENLRDGCLVLEQCSHLSTEAICHAQSRECRCRTSHVESENLMSCLRRVSLGAECEESGQCSTLRTECKLVGESKICTCKSGFVLNAAETMCLPVAPEIGANCFENGQCPWYFAECSASGSPKTCSCSNGYVSSISKQECLKTATIVGNDCKEPLQCSASIPNTNCENSLCTCNPFYEPSDERTECLRVKVNIGDTCDDQTSKCEILGAACSADPDRKCQCLPGYTANAEKTSCQQLTLGGVCLETAQCLINDASCTEADGAKSCTCNGDFVASADNKNCLAKATLIGDACVQNNQCSTPFANSECREAKCQCVADHVASSNDLQCLKTVDLIGDPCTAAEAQVCDIFNTACTNGQCLCTSNFVASQDRARCLTKMDINGTCTEIQQCTDMTQGPVDCVESKCQCKTDSHFGEEKCWQDRKLGDDCEQKVECVLSNGQLDRVDCVDSKCTCLTAFTADLTNNKCNSGVKNAIAFLSLAICVVIAKLF